MEIPAEILAADAVGRIPSDITLSYLAESRDRPAIAAIVFLAVLTGVIMILRCYARLWPVKKIGLDDALAILTMLIYIAIIVLSVILINLGSGRHIEYIQYVLSLDTVRKTEVLDFIAHILYTGALFTCRLSGLAFYHRLAARSGKLYVSIIMAAVFLAAAFLPQIFLLFFHCRPVTGLWPYEWQHEPINYECLSWGLVYSVNSALSLICDVIMFIIPAILIKELHVSLKKKVQLSLVMFPGVLVIVISPVRVYLVTEGQWASDGSWAYNPMLDIENAEIAGTLIALSVPALRPLFGNLLSHMAEYTTSSRNQSSKAKSQTKTTTGLKSAARGSRRLLPLSDHDEYEMVRSEINVSRSGKAPSESDVAKDTTIRVTEEISVVSGNQRSRHV